MSLPRSLALAILLPLALLLAHTLLLPRAFAGDLEDGVRLYHEGEFEQAATRLERAAAALPAGPARARARLFRGLAGAVLALWDRARADFSAALRDDPEIDLDRDANKPSVVALFDDVKKRLVGTLEVTADREASVFVDGALRGPAPLKRRVLAGAHSVRALSADGFAEAIREGALVRGGETTTLALTLELRTGTVSVVSEPAGAAVLLGGRRIATTPASELKLPAGRHTFDLVLEGHRRASLLALVDPAAPARLRAKLLPVDDRPWWRKKRSYAYLSAAVSGALLAGGAIAGVLARSSEAEIASRAREDTLDYDRLRALSDSATSRARAANALFALGGAAAVTSLVLFLVDDRPKGDAHTAPARSSALLVGPLGVAWRTQF